jgi:hypothetical protein
MSAEHTQGHEHHHHWEVDQEPEYLPAKPVLLTLAVATLVSLVGAAIAWFLLVVEEGRLRPSGNFPEKTLGAPGRIPGFRPGDAPRKADIEQVIFQEKVLPGELQYKEQREEQAKFLDKTLDEYAKRNGK